MRKSGLTVRPRCHQAGPLPAYQKSLKSVKRSLVRGWSDEEKLKTRMHTQNLTPPMRIGGVWNLVCDVSGQTPSTNRQVLAIMSDVSLVVEIDKLSLVRAAGPPDPCRARSSRHVDVEF